ncbi:MAG: hypothetical protein CMK56_03115 [Proteobacteria bacterium]|nr:hypothetical protein [Pseudomonadota bacterium]
MQIISLFMNKSQISQGKNIIVYILLEKFAVAIFFFMFFNLPYVQNAHGNPWEKKDLKGLYKSQANVVHRRATNTIDPVLSRLDTIWKTRRKNEIHNFARQPIGNITNDKMTREKYQQSHDAISDYQETFIDSITNHLDENIDQSLIYDNWSYWISGNIEYGKHGSTQNASLINFQSDGLIITFEKNLRQNILLGIGITFGEDKSSAGEKADRMTTNDYGLVIYSHTPIGGTYSIQTIHGFNKYGMYTYREPTANMISGKRLGFQVFNSIRLIKDVKVNKLIFRPYSRFDVGFSSLRPYREEGGKNTISFSEQKILMFKSNLGFLVEYDWFTRFGKLSPHGQIEHVLDLSKSSSVNSFYHNNHGVLHHANIDDLRQSSWRYSLGLDFKFFNSALSASYTRSEESEAHLPDQPNRESDLLMFNVMVNY